MIISFDQIRFNIRNRNYKFIGSGSGRYVFDLGNGYVVKAARNRKGIAQNKVEYQIASMDHSDLFAKILQISEDNELLIMEKANPIDRISVVWKYFDVKSNWELFQLETFKTIASHYSLILQDLRRPENWGIIDGRPVIVDYGFTRRVRKKYYSLF